MKKTWLSVFTAGALVVVSLGLIAARRQALGPEIDGTPGRRAWRVRLEVEGTMSVADGVVVTLLPADFRRQHITNEVYESANLRHRRRRGREAAPRRALWERGPALGPGNSFRLTYSFRCVTGTRRPTAGMTYRSHVIDAPPGEGRFLRPAPGIESEAPEIAELATFLVPLDDEPGENEVRALYNHVVTLDSAETEAPRSALLCLRQRSGSPAGKARLLVALCRNRGIPARLATGLLLEQEGEVELHSWAEAWTGERWLSLDPSFSRVGPRAVGDDYLVLSLRDEDLVQGKGTVLRSQRYFLTDLHESFAENTGPAWWRAFWRRLTLGNLRPEDQEWVRFLLLIPLGALVVSIYRTVIGITTFGTFGPALLGLVCRDLAVLPWALTAFVIIMLLGWLMRRVLDRYHLLLAPRVAALLTAIVIFLIWGVMVAGPFGIVTGGYVALLPLIILTHMVERFWTVEAEDGTMASFRTLLGTVIVAVSVSLVINLEVPINAVARLLHWPAPLAPGLVHTTLFRYPETLGLLLAGQFLLGRYTGYRLTELFRFKDLLLEEPHTGTNHGSVGSLAPPTGDGHPGHESPQHGVHPRPQPPGPVSPS